MNNTTIIQLVGFSAPMISALICAVLVFIYRRKTEEPNLCQLTTLMICSYVSSVFCWLGIILYIGNYTAFVYYNTFFYLVLLLNQVLLYHFVFILTETVEPRRFSAFNYILPIVVTLAVGIWSLFVPFEVQYSIVESRGVNAEGYLACSLFFSFPVPLFCFYNIFYSLKGLYRVRQYRKVVVDYSADADRASMRWLFTVFILILLTVPTSMTTLFWDKGTILNSPIVLLGALMTVFQYVIICYNLLDGNYVIIASATVGEADKESAENEQVITRDGFEKYMRKRKPYLNPNLRITDIMHDLNTNRTYLSAFINQEYGMNFSRYINRSRLNELQRLRRDPAHVKETGLELVLQAGFSNYRGYIRVKSEEDKNTIVAKD